MKILLFVVVFFLVAFSFWFLKNKEHGRAFFALLFAFVTFFVGVLMKETYVPSWEQFVCWSFGGCSLWMSFRFLKDGKHAESLVVFFLAVGVTICGLSAVQGLLKAGILTKVNSSLEDYSKKLDTFQTGMDKSRADLQTNIQSQIDSARADFKSNIQVAIETSRKEFASNTQAEIDSARLDLKTNINSAREDIKHQQTNITSQYEQIFKMQGILEDLESSLNKQIETNSILQSNLLAQGQKLTNVQFQVQHFYELITNEYITGNNTNKFLVAKKSDGGTITYILLDSVPMVNSIHIVTSGSSLIGQMPIVGIDSQQNLINFSFDSHFDTNQLVKTEFDIQYTRNVSASKVYHKMWIEGRNIIASP